MRHHHRGAFWTIAVVHLVAAILTYRAGVPIATPIALALGALAAFGLGFTKQADAADEHPQLGRATSGAAASGTLRDEDGAPEPGTAGRPDMVIGDRQQHDEPNRGAA